MNERGPRNIDPNTDDVEKLSQIPGIGAVMSQRIITARPFERTEDLRRVSGIGPNVLERVRPYLTLPDTEATPPAQDAGEEEHAVTEVPSKAETSADLGEALTEPAPEISGEAFVAETTDKENIMTEEQVVAQVDLVEAKAPPLETEEHEPAAPPETPSKETIPDQAAPPLPQRPSMTPGHVRWLVAISGLLALSLALVLSLGILATLNDGQLQFVTPSQLSALEVRVEGLDVQADDLRQDITGLRTRLNNLEALSGRLDAVEQTAGELRTDLDTTRTDLDATSAQAEEVSRQVTALETDLSNLTQQLSDVEAEVETLHTQSDRFQSFFDGLRDLMETLFSSEGGTP